MYIRKATYADASVLAEIEQICFPPEEKASATTIRERLKAFPDGFWLLEKNGKVVGFVNGLATNEAELIDEMYADTSFHRPHGQWQMIFGVDVLPEYRNRGLAAIMLRRVIDDSYKAKRKGLVLTCKEHLVHYYERFGFIDEGISSSTHGGAIWHKMRLEFHKLSVDIKGVRLNLNTEAGLFSPRNVDLGTLAMLEHVEFSPEDKVLDLGCGYGVVGILAAKLSKPENITMCDVDPLAVETAYNNAVQNGVEGVRVLQSDGLAAIDDRDFTLILSNPPYHTDFSVAKNFIEEGFKRLKIGGKMVMVTKRLDWYKNKLTSVFGGAMVYTKDGYFVFVSEKRHPFTAKKSKRR